MAAEPLVVSPATYYEIHLKAVELGIKPEKSKDLIREFPPINLGKVKVIMDEGKLLHRPRAIRTLEETLRFLSAPEELQLGWNQYAQSSLDADSAAYMTTPGARNPSTVHNWTPRLTFSEWVVERMFTLTK